MKPPLIRQGEGPLAGFRRIREEREKHRRSLDRIVRLAECAPELDSRRVSRATAAGDSARLRGIPAIGRGVSGASPGTQPERAVA